MTSGHERIDEERARAIWLRAAELQAEAARRMEEESRLVPAAGERLPEDGLDPGAVRAAAIEAGISAEFIDLALAESAGAVEGEKGLVGWQDRAATRLLGTDVRRLDFRRVIAVPPSRVLEAMQQVLPNSPYHLTLRDTVGDDPLDGAVLVFHVPGLVGLSYTAFAYRMSWADLRELRFVLRPLDGGARTEVSVTIPLERSRRINWLAGHILPAGGGFVGGIAGMVVAKAAALAGTAVAAPIAVGALALAGAGSWGMKAAYRAGLRKGHEEVDGILKTLDVTCRLGTGFLPSGQKPAPRETDGLGDLTI